MVKSILKVVFRNLWKYKSYTLINIIGLGLGIAALVWGYLNYRFSFSFDNFHPDIENVYRVVTKKDGANLVQGIVPMPVALHAKNDLPGIAATVRLDGETMNVKGAKPETFSEFVQFADTGFFSLFNFPLLYGDNKLANKDAVLISESVAKKYFGSERAIGKVLQFYAGKPHERLLTVTGVLKDAPPNSSIQPGFLTHFENLLKSDGAVVVNDDWRWFANAIFFKIPNRADAAEIEKKLAQYVPIQNKLRQDWKASGFQLLSLKQHAKDNILIDSNGLKIRPEDASAYGPIVLSFLLLLSACLNFANTTIARANQKLKEIGVRKVMGGTRQQLMIQLLMECAGIVIIAICLSALINLWWLPAYNKMFVYLQIEADYLHDHALQLFLLAALLFTTILAGAYPAGYITAFNPSGIFRGNVKFGGQNIFSRVMLGLQISIAIITVIAGIAFANNAEFQRNFDYGYHLDRTLNIAIPDKTTYTALRSEMVSLPEVTGISGARFQLGIDYRSRILEAKGEKNEVRYLEVGDEYLEVMGLKLFAGRGFNKGTTMDYANAVLITQKAAALYGWKDKEALNQQVKIDSVACIVVGILKDFHPDQLFDPLEAVAIRLAEPDQYRHLVIQANTADLTRVHDKAKVAWQKLFPLVPFNAYYQSEMKAEGQKISSNVASIFGWFSLVSIMLTITGLFALVSLTILKRTKEIAIRKIAGASTQNILALISKGYLFIFVFAAMFGAAAGWFLTKVLLDLIFKINNGINGAALVWAVMSLLTIAAFIAGAKVWQSARANPVNMLRSE